MTPFETVRLQAANALGLPHANAAEFTVADFQALSPDQSQALDDVISLYIVSNPAGMTAGQVAAAQSIIGSPSFAARFVGNYQAATTGLVQTVKNSLASGGAFLQSAAEAAVPAGTNYLKNAALIGLLVLGAIVLWEWKPWKK